MTSIKIEINHLCEIMMLNLFLKPPSIIQKNEKRTIKIFVKATEKGIAKARETKVMIFSFEKIFI